MGFEFVTSSFRHIQDGIYIMYSITYVNVFCGFAVNMYVLLVPDYELVTFRFKHIHPTTAQNTLKITSVRLRDFLFVPFISISFDGIRRRR